MKEPAVLDLTAAASQTLSKLFYKSLSVNDVFILGLGGDMA